MAYDRRGRPGDRYDGMVRIFIYHQCIFEGCKGFCSQILLIEKLILQMDLLAIYIILVVCCTVKILLTIIPQNM